MSKLTAEEIKERNALLSEIEKELEDDADAVERQRFEALRLRKKFSSKGLKHGADFAVVETKIGNFVIRKPKDIEIDTLVDAEDGRAPTEAFCAAISLEPPASEIQAIFPDNPGLIAALSSVALDLAKVARKEEAKK